MNASQKIDIIIKYKELMMKLQNELMNYFELNSIKRILLLNFLKEKLGYEITNMAFYEKLKNANRWKPNEIPLIFEFMHQPKKRDIAEAFWDLLNNKVNDDIEKSPFQFKFLTFFFKEYFDITFAGVWYQPWRWELNLDALIELYRLIEHMERFNFPTPITPKPNKVVRRRKKD
jgi:hypothetical protein